MGEAFIVVNKTKKEYIHPHTFGDGYKLGEILCSARGTLTALGVLLLDEESHDHQHLDEDGRNALWVPKMLGRWVDDSIVMLGEYSNSQDPSYEVVRETWADISWFVRQAVGRLIEPTGYLGSQIEPEAQYDETTNTFKRT